jgi:hypothetical protein
MPKSSRRFYSTVPQGVSGRRGIGSYSLQYKLRQHAIIDLCPMHSRCEQVNKDFWNVSTEKYVQQMINRKRLKLQRVASGYKPFDPTQSCGWHKAESFEGRPSHSPLAKCTYRQA